MMKRLSLLAIVVGLSLQACSTMEYAQLDSAKVARVEMIGKVKIGSSFEEVKELMLKNNYRNSAYTQGNPQNREYYAVFVKPDGVSSHGQTIQITLVDNKVVSFN